MPSFEPVDFDPFASARQPIPSEGRALLGAIAGGESPNYNTMYGGGTFTDFADHPRQAIPIISGPNAGRTSSAAGMYQFLAPTWDDVKKQAGLTDFSPESQDYGAWFLANQVYAKKTGRDLLGDLQLAKGDPAKINMIGRYLADTWTSIPGGIEPNKATGGFGQRYAQGLGPTEMSAQSRKGPQFTPVDFDPFEGGKFADTLGPNFRTAREGVSEAAPPPKTFADKAMEVWDKPYPGGIVSVVKPFIQGAHTYMRAMSGEIPITDENGNTNLDIIHGAADIARSMPLSATSGLGVFGAPVGKGLATAAPVAAERVVPTVQQLKTAAREGYQSPEVAGLELNPSALAGFAQATKGSLSREGFNDTPKNARDVFTTLTSLENPPTGAIQTGQNLHSLKKNLGMSAREVGTDGLPTPNAAAAAQALRELDQWIPTIAEKDVLAGNAAAAKGAIKTADANYSAAKTAHSIDRNVIKAENRAGATHSGQNVANTVRQRLATVMNDESQFNRFQPAEQEMIRSIVHGTPTANAVRFVGKALGGGGGLGTVAVATGGGLATGGIGAGLPVVGFALNAISNRMTLNQAAKLSEAIRSRAPLANAMKALEQRATEYSKAQTPRAIAGLNLAARNLSNNMRDIGINMSAADIMRAFSGGAQKTAADQDQQQ